MNAMIRSMVADDMYYPGSPEDLRHQLQRALAKTTGTAGTARVVVGPYGAYELTLTYMMEALRAATRRKPERVVILAPPHASASGRVLIPESDLFATPFGALPVDHEVLLELIDSSTLFTRDEFSHLRDHSIETMLPPLHYLFGPIPIVPILVGALSPALLRHAARTLEATLSGHDSLVVVSANLSGFTTPPEADARSRAMVRLIMNSPGEGILGAMETLENPPRSLWPIVLGHLLAGEDSRPAIVNRGTFDTEYDGDTGSVVFASIVYT
jgi:MEMO1 family protein